jgi:hypothetical protein
MRVALITTTINVPAVLHLYRKLGPDVKFFIALDKNSDFEGISKFGVDAGNTWLTPTWQNNWACSESITWLNDSRRNIALLEAVKYGADFIVSIDDDMAPLGLDFFERFEIMLSEPYSGLQLGTSGHWCDVGRCTFNSAPQRGLPPGVATLNEFSFAQDVQIGAMQGIILGTPDTDAGTTMARHPFVHSATDILRGGFAIDPLAKSVFNSQLTAFRRELAPCFAQFYKWQGRNTDIMASLIMRRIMRERDLHTYFGPPFGFHNRSPRDPKKDFAAEQWGRENVVRFQDCLDATILTGGTVTEQTRYLYVSLAYAGHIPGEMLTAVHAFLDDIEPLL